MKESTRAERAWADYLALGPDRSIEKLYQRYRNGTDSVPTKRRNTLKVWSGLYGWQQRLLDIAARQAADTEAREMAARAELQALGIGARQNRLAHLNQRHSLLRQVIAERAEAKEFATVAGGTTGLLVHTIKQVGAGETAEIVHEYALDPVFLRESREHEKQAAIEVGEWIEKGEVRGNKDAPVIVEHIGASEVHAAELAFLRLLGVKPSGLGDDTRDHHPSDAGAHPV